MPSDPEIIAISSERMSPKRFSVTSTSKDPGRRMSCMAALSTYMWDSSTSGNSLAISITVSRQRTEEARTFALSTDRSFLRRPMAAMKATRAIRWISDFL